MNNESNNENGNASDNAEIASAPEACAPGCDCKMPGLSRKGKMIVCLVIGVAATAVLARGLMRAAKDDSETAKGTFSTRLPMVQTGPASSTGGKGTETGQALWSETLASLAGVNKVAADKDAVFIFFPADDDEQVQAMKKIIGSAAVKITSRGTATTALTLGKDTDDYAKVTSQTAAPCVVTLVKGTGMGVMVADITEANLLKSVVMASRSSGCGPTTCAPGACP